MELEKYLSVDVMELEITADKKEDVIDRMVRLLCADKDPDWVDAILRTIFIREEDRSTAIGNGVAIPHARSDLAKTIFLALGRSRVGVPWGSEDGKPVHFIFLVVGPQKASQDYLRVLADISRLMTRSSVRNALLEARNATEVLQIIRASKARRSVG
jgi:mannitol/fructose-specific phosphotransferase system IIA component (Ntr-type)